MTYNQGHRKLYEWVKLNEDYQHAKFDISHIYSVRENSNVKVCATYGQSAGRPITGHYKDSHFSCESKLAHALHGPILMQMHSSVTRPLSLLLDRISITASMIPPRKHLDDQQVKQLIKMLDTTCYNVIDFFFFFFSVFKLKHVPTVRSETGPKRMQTN